MHTPGPWTQQKNENHWSILGADRVGRDGITSAPISVIVKSCPEAKANARLIAAAPALLEALKGVVALIGDDATLGESDYVNAARAAIAAARGEGVTA